MRTVRQVWIAGLLFLIACSDAKKPNGANFTKAINEYLMKHGGACTVISRQFPVDVPESERKEEYGIGLQLAVLEQAGLVHASDTTAIIHGMLDALRGPTPPQPVKHYELTGEGKRYFQQIPSTMGPSNGFCYGRKTVDSIVKWTEPTSMGASTQTEVTYTYKIADPASWAQRPDIQRAFSNIRTTFSEASKAPQIAGLQLTNKGWEVPGQ